MTHFFEWPEFKLRADGVLVYADNNVPLADAQTRIDGSTPVFANIADAEAWLVTNDVRGTVR